MLFPVAAYPRYSFRASNLPANFDAVITGTSVTPGGSNAEGSWTQTMSGGTMAQESHWLYVAMNASLVIGSARPTLVDIGTDPAGGTSYGAVVSNLLAGNCGSGTGFTGQYYLFPLRIKSGSTVAARAQGSAATGSAMYVGTEVWGQPDRPERIPVGSFVDTIGTVTNSGGVSVTPGNGAWGSYVSLGTTSNALWWWNLGVQCDNAAQSALHYYFELAYGDATNKQSLIKLALSSDGNERTGEFSRMNQVPMAAYKPLPVGAELFVRGICSGTPDSGWTALAYGVGG